MVCHPAGGFAEAHPCAPGLHPRKFCVGAKHHTSSSLLPSLSGAVRGAYAGSSAAAPASGLTAPRHTAYWAGSQGTRDLGDFLPVRGRKPQVPAAVLLRELDLADVQQFENAGTAKPPELVRIREVHHALARALAAGCSEAEAAAITGYSSSRISILKADPAFADLVELYRRDVNAVYLDMHAQLAGLSMDATLALRERINETPEEVETKDLIKAAEMGADRTGFGPASKSTNLNVNITATADRLKAARLRSGLLAEVPGTHEEPVV